VIGSNVTWIKGPPPSTTEEEIERETLSNRGRKESWCTLMRETVSSGLLGIKGTRTGGGELKGRGEILLVRGRKKNGERSDGGEFAAKMGTSKRTRWEYRLTHTTSGSGDLPDRQEDRKKPYLFSGVDRPSPPTSSKLYIRKGRKEK